MRTSTAENPPRSPHHCLPSQTHLLPEIDPPTSAPTHKLVHEYLRPHKNRPRLCREGGRNVERGMVEENRVIAESVHPLQNACRGMKHAMVRGESILIHDLWGVHVPGEVPGPA